MDSLIEKLKSHPNIQNFNQHKKVKFIQKQTYPLLSYNPDCKKSDILNLLRKNDQIICKVNEFTDKYTLISVLLKSYNPKDQTYLTYSNLDVFRFDIGISASNGNKIKAKHPPSFSENENLYFTAKINSVQKENLSSGESISRPIVAEILKPFDHFHNQINCRFLEEIENSAYKSEGNFDKKFRTDQFKSLLDNSNKVFIWPNSSYLDSLYTGLPDENSSKSSIQSYSKNRRNYAKLRFGFEGVTLYQNIKFRKKFTC